MFNKTLRNLKRTDYGNNCVREARFNINYDIYNFALLKLKIDLDWKQLIINHVIVCRFSDIITSM